eukprot:688453-Pleurochrysis_carterae.AAC.1
MKRSPFCALLSELCLQILVHLPSVPVSEPVGRHAPRCDAERSALPARARFGLVYPMYLSSLKHYCSTHIIMLRYSFTKFNKASFRRCGASSS